MPTAPLTFRQKNRRQEREKSRGTRQQRGYTDEWVRMARMYRAQHPVCEMCQDAPAVDVDHVIPFTSLGDPLRTEWRNLQSLCRACHRMKTERQRRCARA